MSVKSIAALICFVFSLAFSVSSSANIKSKIACLKDCKEECVGVVQENADAKDKKKAIIECMISCHKEKCKKPEAK